MWNLRFLSRIFSQSILCFSVALLVAIPASADSRCACPAVLMDFISIKLVELGRSVSDASFDRSECGEFPSCGGECWVSIKGILPDRIGPFPCEPLYGPLPWEDDEDLVDRDTFEGDLQTRID